MNCFEWHTRTSDYLDGTLIGNLKREADEHLDSCSGCQERYQHYRQIIQSIAAQPRATLPIPLRKAPMSAVLPRLDMTRISRSRWEQIPWYLRTTLEGTGIVFLILLGISTGPKIRSLYERSVERNLSELNEAFSNNNPFSSDTSAFNLPLSRGKSVASTAPGAAPEGAAVGDDFASEGNEDDSDEDVDGSNTRDSADKDIKVGKSEIWRFNLKTDSPHEMRPKIVALLNELQVPAETPGLGGIEAPGGIQFDLLIPQSIVPGLKKQLTKLAPHNPESLSGATMAETFTWYKNRSARPIPNGMTRVVIWLSQL